MSAPSEPQREPRFVYVGLCARCGHPNAATADVPLMRGDNAEFVADLIRRGATVERWALVKLSDAVWCDCLAGVSTGSDQP